MKVGGGRLRPVTLGGLALLHSIKSPFLEDGTPSALDTFTAGYILSRPWMEAWGEHQDGKLGDNAIAWTKANHIDKDDLAAAVSEQISVGFSSAAQVDVPQDDGSILIESPSPDGTGMGYLLTIIETLCSIYHWTVEYTLNRPVVTAYAMVAAHRINEGAKWREPNYFERDRDMGEVKAYLERMKA